jgi:ribosomal protein L25 (general stress protein Ctc)
MPARRDIRLQAQCDKYAAELHSANERIKDLENKIMTIVYPNKKAEERIKVLEDALRKAICAGEYVVKLCEDDYKCGASPNPMVKSMPSAVIAECYAAMSFLNQAREALEVKP